MKETTFIDQNKEKWRRFEELSKQSATDPDELNKLFVEITEDLSYARTFYPRRSVRVYLNYLAQNVFNRLYKKRRESAIRFLDFWRTSLPLEMYRARKSLLYAFLIFTICCTIGVVSTAYDINFARTILSDGYVEMTDDFIEQGDPMRVYKLSDPFDMFFRIFTNNIVIGFFCFILGIFGGIGTSFFLIFNGIMLGSFQSYFYYRGISIGQPDLLYTSFLSIWIHGAFEISAIILSGVAGITLGNGLLFPGSYSRLQSLQISARRGLKIMIGITPFFLFAAILESWVTRQTWQPEYFKLAVISGSFAIVLFYFVLYPVIVARKYPGAIETREEPPQTAPVNLSDKYKIRQTNEIFSESFGWYKSTFRFFSGPFFLILLPLQVIFAWWYMDYHPALFNKEFSWFDLTANYLGLNAPSDLIPFFFHSFYWSLLAATIYHAVTYTSEMKTKSFTKSWFLFCSKNVLKILPVIICIYAILAFLPNILIFLISVGLPVLFFLLYPVVAEKKNFFVALGENFKLGLNSFGQGILLLPVYVLIATSFFLLIYSGGYTGTIITSFIEWHYIMETSNFIMTHNFVELMLTILFLTMIIPLVLFGFVLFYYSQTEKQTAHSLYERLKKFGKKNRQMETESDYES